MMKGRKKKNNIMKIKNLKIKRKIRNKDKKEE
jgi:hypothetical protein